MERSSLFHRAVQSEVAAMLGSMMSFMQTASSSNGAEWHRKPKNGGEGEAKREPAVSDRVCARSSKSIARLRPMLSVCS